MTSPSSCIENASISWLPRPVPPAASSGPVEFTTSRRPCPGVGEVNDTRTHGSPPSAGLPAYFMALVKASVVSRVNGTAWSGSIVSGWMSV